MKRKQFFTALGISAGTVLFAPYLISCSKDNATDPGSTPGGSTGGTVDFTLDLSLPANSALNTNGGSLINSGVLVAKTSAGSFIAVASLCTHEGFILGFNSSTSQFHCSNHGSNFTTAGAVVNGPATSALKKYNTTLTGTSLRIYS
jgi:cytochrome b6-f complex iron-sulfur subunit